MSQASLKVNLDKEWSKDTLGEYGQNPDIRTPFKFYIFPDLLEAYTVYQLRDDINSSIRLKTKDNDLYKFKQSKDLKSEIPSKKVSPLLHRFIDVMLDKVRPHLEKSTGLKLSTKHFDITASRYDVGNYLLCHNDDIKDNLKQHERTLAFIYYLNSRPWSERDGGALAIYNSDSAGEPVEINNRIFPRPNTLIVFKTGSTSWHSVEKVNCRDDFRLSINGWFHTDAPAKISESPRVVEPCPYNFVRPIPLDERVEKFFKECVNEQYLMEKTCMIIRRQFKRKSEINLKNFLVKEKYLEICRALKDTVSDERNLSLVGPYNKRNYKVIQLDKLPPICQDLFDAFRSELFFMLLARLTGLDLQPPSLMSEAQKQQAGNKDSGDDLNDDEDDDDDDDDDDDEDDDDDDDEDEEDSDGGLSDEDSDDDDNDNDVDDTKVSKEVGPDAGTNLLQEIKKDDGNKQSTSREAKIKVESDNNARPKKRKRISDPLARLDFRHLGPGSYTLIHDQAYELGEKSALDVILHFNHDFVVNSNDGGYITYIDAASEDDLHDMDAELLTVDPKSNCLSLVYRCDESTCRFLKHISSPTNYQDLYCVYYERPDDLPDRGKGKMID